MKTLINLEPIHQTGHNCKITTIATVDKYFADQLGFEPIPLHKKKTAPISIRQLSKAKGSQQGELLEIRQFSEIFAELGYETELIDFQDNYDSFQANVTSNINQGNLVIACFAVDRRTGLPSTNYENDNEHAAILHGFDDETGELDMTHWDQHRKTTMKDLYDSSMVLLKQRNPEYYVNVKRLNKNQKYDLYSEQTGEFPPACYKKSIIPTPNSGFRGKLLVIKQPELKNILEARQRLLPEKPRKLFTELKPKTDELIIEPSIQEEHTQTKPDTPSSSTTNISMMVLGGFIAAAGITAVAIAFAVLNAVTLGIPGLVVAPLGVAATLSGIGLFVAGAYKNRMIIPDELTSGNVI